jgi:hypothetical protein
MAAATRADLPRTLGMLDTIAIVIGIGYFSTSQSHRAPSTIGQRDPRRVDCGGFAFSHWRVCLRRTGGNDAGHGRAVCLSARSLRALVRVCERLDFYAGGAVGWERLASCYLLHLCRLFRVVDASAKQARVSGFDSGVRESAWVQRTFTYLKIGAILVLIGAGLFYHRAVHVVTVSRHGPISLADFGLPWRRV